MGEEIRDIVLTALAGAFGFDPGDFDEHATLAELGDSLDLMDAVIELEERFDMEIDDEVADAWRTVADVIAFCERAAQ